MITFVSVLKPCEGRTGLAQRQAVMSWARLGTPGDVILLGDEPGIGELSADLGVRWLPIVRRNRFGTPLLDDVLTQARAASTTPLLCYLNGDIILDGRFTDAARLAGERLDSFLVIGQCLNLDVPDELMTGATPAEPLVALGMECGSLRGHDFVDYFLFTRDVFTDVPPFALGRAGFDNWLIWSARAGGAAVVDATPFQLPIHQNHDYGHVAGGAAWAYAGEEAAENIALAGGRRHLLTTLDSTHRLTPSGVRSDVPGRLRLRSRLLRARITAARLLGRAAF